MLSIGRSDGMCHAFYWHMLLWWRFERSIQRRSADGRFHPATSPLRVQTISVGMKDLVSFTENRQSSNRGEGIALVLDLYLYLVLNVAFMAKKEHQASQTTTFSSPRVGHIND